MSNCSTDEPLGRWVEWFVGIQLTTLFCDARTLGLSYLISLWGPFIKGGGKYEVVICDIFYYLQLYLMSFFVIFVL
jgi:hypothetical protein